MRSLLLRSVCIAGIALVAVSIFAKDKQTGSPQSANLHFNVVKDDNDHPVRNAGVVLHPVGKNGKQSKGGLELKTDNEGNASMEGIPYGLLRIQVLAPGMQSFGDDYQVDKPEMEIKIRLKRPSDQMSVYGKQQGKQPAPPATAPATPPAAPKPN
ncbi:MAG TPA: carboxypeptidase-like regulatory domain-containing protein [Candidatus Angelobacter sp.]|nr:carboxypeptidase-like regulatory domain-containing protein [Candidatus Angelobacter sp.]